MTRYPVLPHDRTTPVNAAMRSCSSTGHARTARSGRMKDRWCPLITTPTAFGGRRRWCPECAAQGPAEWSTAAVAFCVEAAGTFPIARSARPRGTEWLAAGAGRPLSQSDGTLPAAAPSHIAEIASALDVAVATEHGRARGNSVSPEEEGRRPRVRAISERGQLRVKLWVSRSQPARKLPPRASSAWGAAVATQSASSLRHERWRV